MVVKRQCSFCAGEVEPGTGTMFVKRDGTVYYFCSSSCRKQQLHLGRVGHRLKWTRAHAVKRAQAQSTAQRSGRNLPAPSAPAAPAKPAAPPVPSPAPAASPAPVAEPEAATAAVLPAKEEPPAKEAPAKAKPAPKSRAKPAGGGAKSTSSKPPATPDKT